jgi:hypothetical protein
MKTHEQARRMVIRFLLDKFGRLHGAVCPFYVYCKLPNYTPIPTEENGKLQIFAKITNKLLRTGFDHSKRAQILDDKTYISYCSLLDGLLNIQGYRFSMDDIESMFMEVQMFSVIRYSKLQKREINRLQMVES